VRPEGKVVIILSTLTLLTAGLFGCSKTCDRQFTSTSSIKNATGRALSLSVCVAGVAKAQQIEVAPNQNGDMLVESHTEKTKITGNPKDQCADQQQSSSVFLTSESFNDVKFCHNLLIANGPLQIVEQSQTCPQGTTAQAGAVDECASLQGTNNNIHERQ